MVQKSYNMKYILPSQIGRPVLSNAKFVSLFLLVPAQLSLNNFRSISKKQAAPFHTDQGTNSA